MIVLCGIFYLQENLTETIFSIQGQYIAPISYLRPSLTLPGIASNYFSVPAVLISKEVYEVSELLTSNSLTFILYAFSHLTSLSKEFKRELNSTYLSTRFRTS